MNRANITGAEKLIVVNKRPHSVAFFKSWQAHRLSLQQRRTTAAAIRAWIIAHATAKQTTTPAGMGESRMPVKMAHMVSTIATSAAVESAPVNAIRQHRSHGDRLTSSPPSIAAQSPQSQPSGQGCRALDR
jgi:hypothetical protein